MSKYHLRKLTFHFPNINQVEDFFSYSTDVTTWKNAVAVRNWAVRADNNASNNHIAKRILGTPEFCLTIDVVLDGLNETEAKAAKRTAIAMSLLAGHIIVNKQL